MNDQTLELTQELIKRPSVTPQDEGCQQLIAESLSAAGFVPEHMRFGDVDNLWIRRNTGPPLLVFAGHTDVVPPGPIGEWRYDPFVPTLENGYLYGRGAADMKTSIAAFVTAVQRFVEDHPDHRGSVALLLTSDEEGPAVDGTAKVVEKLLSRGEHIDYCLVGEPTSVNTLGDMIKVGRRGSLSGRLAVHGVQGHVAYPHLAENPIHLCAPLLSDLAGASWDCGDEYFPATTFQVTSVTTATDVDNVIPGSVAIKFNFRHSTASTSHSLIKKVESMVESHCARYDLEWTVSGAPFLTSGGSLVSLITGAIEQELGITTEASTTGGTSDGRFIAPTGAEVVELGPVNETIHKVNECVDADAPQRLSNVYYRILVAALTGNAHGE